VTLSKQQLCAAQDELRVPRGLSGLQPDDAAWLLAVIEGTLRATRWNGSSLPPHRRAVVAALAFAAPEAALRLPGVRDAIGPEQAAAVQWKAESRLVETGRVTAMDTQAIQPAPLAGTASQPPIAARPYETGPLSTAEAARMVGLQPQSVRAAIRRNRLEATMGPDGKYRVTVAAVEKWRA
jgi:hypothetical protein